MGNCNEPHGFSMGKTSRFDLYGFRANKITKNKIEQGGFTSEHWSDHYCLSKMVKHDFRGLKFRNLAKLAGWLAASLLKEVLKSITSMTFNRVEHIRFPKWEPQ